MNNNDIKLVDNCIHVNAWSKTYTSWEKIKTKLDYYEEQQKN